MGVSMNASSAGVATDNAKVTGRRRPKPEGSPIAQRLGGPR
jgi:hypothetical protein